MMRRMGGWIEEHRGKQRVRTRIAGRIETVDVFDTVEEAEGCLRGLAALRAGGDVAPVETLRTWGEAFLNHREKALKLRSWANDRNRWKNHVEPHPIADRALVDVARRDVKAWLTWLGERVASWQTRKHCLNLVRKCLAWAVEEERRGDNPAAGLLVTRPADAHETEGWTYLLPDEQSALLTKAPRALRADVLLAAVALGTGLRQGEQWNLELRDLHLEEDQPWLLVRCGSKGKPPKSGKMRRVPLFGIALAALREWLAGLPTFAPANPLRLVFPTARGCRRGKSKVPRGWSRMLAAAGLTAAQGRHDGRGVRWHDLRHTCASSLVAGWWGRPWRLEEVREVLGHSSVTTTELYAHLAPGVLADAATATSGGALGSTGLLPAPRGRDRKTPISKGRAKQDSNLRPSASEGGPELSDLARVRALGEHLGSTEARYLSAVVGRSRFVRSVGMDLADAAKAYREAVERLVGVMTEAPRPRLRAVRGGGR
jgi:integrase